ncbi:hypothetical protein RGQ13_15125 [Thalassotalea psychrophila]|uniref:Uncharacterized protein n=1 Tax=Thalassotalea psychrophila TaxID=3065647 RepID=A0ABY9TRK8_9GAMM|nr:hypothetical protein RGQ13_15125 [Colwelliaceae bacterium SQ149]
MKILTIIVEFILYTMLLGLLGLPLALVVLHPSEAEHFIRFSETMIPWGVVLLLCAIFSDGIRSVMHKLVEAIGRIKSVSAGGAAVELNQSTGTPATPEQIEGMRAHMQQLSAQNQDAANLASHFFLKYVSNTIFGSQFRFLKALQDSPLTPTQAVAFYNQFVASAPEGTNYPFESWAGYLTDNLMVNFDAATGQYQVTPAALNVINQAKAANFNDNIFPH